MFGTNNKKIINKFNSRFASCNILEVQNFRISSTIEPLNKFSNHITLHYYILKQIMLWINCLSNKYFTFENNVSFKLDVLNKVYFIMPLSAEIDKISK